LEKCSARPALRPCGFSTTTQSATRPKRFGLSSGGAEPKNSLTGARVNVLTTKVDRYRALSEQTALMNAIR